MSSTNLLDRPEARPALALVRDTPRTMLNDLAMEGLAAMPIPPRATTLPRGVHAMPFVYSPGKALLLVAVSAAGVVVADEEVDTIGQREGAIEYLEEQLNRYDPPVIAAVAQ